MNGTPHVRTPAVFVYGALRSGTTMFRLMLENHPQISNPGEADFLFDHLRPDASHATGWRYDLTALRDDRIFRASGLSLPDGIDGLDLLEAMLAAMAQKDAVLTLNIHRHADRIAATCPDARYIHLVRDPRDVARSVIGMGWAGTLWRGVDMWIATEEGWDGIVDRLSGRQVFSKRRLPPTRDQLDGLKFQGRRSSIWPCGWPAAIASRVALR